MNFTSDPRKRRCLPCLPSNNRRNTVSRSYAKHFVEAHIDGTLHSDRSNWRTLNHKPDWSSTHRHDHHHIEFSAGYLFSVDSLFACVHCSWLNACRFVCSINWALEGTRRHTAFCHRNFAPKLSNLCGEIAPLNTHYWRKSLAIDSNKSMALP